MSQDPWNNPQQEPGRDRPPPPQHRPANPYPPMARYGNQRGEQPTASVGHVSHGPVNYLPPAGNGVHGAAGGSSSQKSSPWSRLSGGWRVVIILGIAAVFFAAYWTYNSQASDAIKAEITSCSASGDLAKAVLTVRNTSKAKHSAAITIEYREASGARLDTDVTNVKDLAGGDTARVEENTILEADPNGKITCAITKIEGS